MHGGRGTGRCDAAPVTVMYPVRLQPPRPSHHHHRHFYVVVVCRTSLLLPLVLLLFCHLRNVEAINPVSHSSSTSVSAASGAIFPSVSGQSAPRQHGTLTSPNFPRTYSQGINCVLYTIVAGHSQIVELTFVEFDMAPHVKNRCVDFLRVYLDMDSPAINERHAWSYELCGNMSMINKRYYSSTPTMILELHTEAPPRPTPASSTSRVPRPTAAAVATRVPHAGFRAIYRYVEKSEYEMVGGSRRWGTTCAYDFYSQKSSNGTTSNSGGMSSGSLTGRFFSPRYPQNYPPSTSCQYVFNGKKNEHVQIIFENIQLEHIDGSCVDSPDYITVRDGPDMTYKSIARLCNTMNGERIVSSGKHLFVEFVSDARNERQGFAATYAFVPATTSAGGTVAAGSTQSEHLVLREQHHQRGVGNGGAHGQLPPAEDLLSGQPEAPADDRTWVGVRPSGDAATGSGRDGDWGPVSGSSRHEVVGSGGRIVVGGDAVDDDRLNVNGNQQNPGDSPSILTPPHSANSGGNKKFFWSDCDQTFDSQDRKSGVFTSPNYPSSYPANKECRYSFEGHEKERVQIAFVDFDLSQNTGDSSDFGPHRENPSCDDVDSIHVAVFVNDVPKDINTYCGRTLPPMLMSSDTRMIITFTSRGTPSSAGFRANYSFVTDYGIKSGKQSTSANSDCRFEYKRDVGANGTFTSPNYPGLYPRNVECHYLFFGKENEERVYITFQEFEVDGLPSCRDDTMSDYVEFSNFNTGLTDRKMPRMCGTKEQLLRKEVQSDSSFFRVTFKSNDVYDSTGFKALYQFRLIEDPTAALRKTGPGSNERSSASGFHRRTRGSLAALFVATATHCAVVLAYVISSSICVRHVAAIDSFSTRCQ